MAMFVRLVRGEWRRDEDGLYEHVAALEGFTLAVRLREKDDYATVVSAVKNRLGLSKTEEVELTYQWPQWMMGPDWKRANPIHIENDEDMALFMAIRADLEEVHLRVKVTTAERESVLNADLKVAGELGMNPASVSDRYWNCPETRAIWDNALSHILARNDNTFVNMFPREDNAITDTLLSNLGNGKHANTPYIPGRVGAHWGIEGRQPTPGGIKINEPVMGTTSTAKVRNPGSQPITYTETPGGMTRKSAKEKGKQKMYEAPFDDSPDFEEWRKHYAAEMWRDVCETEMTLGNFGCNQRMRRGQPTAARVLDFGKHDTTGHITEESLRLSLSAPVSDKQSPPILTLSSDDSSYDDPTSKSAIMSTSSENSYEDMVPGANIDRHGPFILSPLDPSELGGGSERAHEQVLAIVEQGSGSRTPRAYTGDELGLKETPVPTVLHDRDAPPYVDDPWEEDYLQRAITDADYEGDDIFVGRLFKNKEDCATKLAIHAIRRKFHFITARSRPHLLVAVCVSHTCPWRVYATKLEDSDRFEVRSITLQHTCNVDARGDFHKQASTAVIGKLMRTRYMGVGRGPRTNELRKILRQEFSLNISYWKAWRAREIAMDNAMGSALGSYALIQPYFKLLLETNPNSIVALETETDKSGMERFKYLFFSLHASIQGYQYMRKVVVIDGTHLRGRYGGCLIAASTQDANFQIFPLAFAIVNSENDEAWTWFLEKLTAIVPDEPELVFVSDRHSSIFTSIRKVYPMSSHAACVVHLKRNILSIYKSEQLSFLVSCAARAYRLKDFNKIFGEIRAMNGQCADYLAGIGFEHWTRSHFVGNRYNVMTSNIAETLNNVLTMARDYPVMS